MKVLSMEEAQERFAKVCQEALAGELIRLRLADGALLQLTPVPAVPPPSVPPDRDLASCYDDQEWAEFENHCGKASD